LELWAMIEWLVVWGVTQAAGVVVYPILQGLAQDAAKDYGKDFFKDCLKKVTHLPEKDVLKLNLSHIAYVHVPSKNSSDKNIFDKCCNVQFN